MCVQIARRTFAAKGSWKGRDWSLGFRVPREFSMSSRYFVEAEGSRKVRRSKDLQDVNSVHFMFPYPYRTPVYTRSNLNIYPIIPI